MRYMALSAAVAVVVAGLWLPGEAAQPAAPAPAANTSGTTGSGDTITFEQYRDWRNDFTERRRAQLASQLAAPDLPAQRQARLGEAKAYYDWLAGLSAEERDRRYRARFDQIDANHDGIIDAAERAAWHDKQRTRYARFPSRDREPASLAAAPR